MSTRIPTYQLNTFTARDGTTAAVFFLGPESAQPTLPTGHPYRSNYYKIGIMLRGSARLQVNLESYDLGPGCLMVLPPAVIKQWDFMSDDCEALSIFFSQEFVTATSSLHPDSFPFFTPAARPVVQLTPTQADSLAELLSAIGQKYQAPHAYRDEILRSFIHILLHETAAIYSQQPVATAASQPRSQLIAAEFKQLVNRHCTTERSLAFYAGRLCITPKHLAETVREATGQRASEWIAEAVTLEAKVLLQKPNLTIAQAADLLQFTDQSAFGRFFRKSTGLSPATYRQRL